MVGEVYPRLAAAVIAGALAAGAWGCGGSDDDDGTGQSQADRAATTEQTQVPDTPAGQIRLVFDQLQDAFRQGDAAAICSELTQPAQTQTVKIAGKGNADCQEAVQGLIDQWGPQLAGRPKIEKLRVDGNTAVMTIRTGKDTTSRITTQKVEFVRNADGWKVNQQIGGTF